MINSSTPFHPFRWIGGAVIAVVVAYLVGLGNSPLAAAPATQCVYTSPSAVAPTR